MWKIQGISYLSGDTARKIGKKLIGMSETKLLIYKENMGKQC